MDSTRREDWSRKLLPIRLDAEPIDAQLARRLGVAVVGSGLLAGLMVFFAAIFAGFGAARFGLLLDGLILPVVGWIWWGHLRLRRAVAAYRRARIEEGSPV